MTTPDPDEYGEIVVTWNGPVVDQAPRRARISLELFQTADPRALRVHGSCITVGDDAEGRPVTYVVTGWEPNCLLVERTSP